MNEQKVENRLEYFDTLRLFACTLIFFMHYASRYNPDVQDIIYSGALGMIMYGVTAKWATTMLAVIAGYFAYNCGTKYNTLNYIVKRYCTFFIMVLFTLLITRLLNLFSTTPNNIEIVLQSIFLDYKFYPQLWWIRSFFFGSIISFLNKRYSIKPLFIMLEIIICLCLNCVWVGICLFGNFIYILEKNHNNLKSISKLIVFIVFVFFLRRNGENNITYLCWGISSMLLIIFVQNSLLLRKTLSNRFFSIFGKKSMDIFLLHRNVYLLFGYSLFNLIKLPYSISFFIVFIVLFLITFLFSIPLDFLIKKASNYLSSFILCNIINKTS